MLSGDSTAGSDDEDYFDVDDSDDEDYRPENAKSSRSEITLRQKIAAVKYWEEVSPKRTLSSVNLKYRFITSITQLKRFKAQIEKG